ncbi:MAG: PilC/PilY family type IV pilus protein [Nitrospirae bacterium]|nr:PilC/PilY family type IV pilus protein [Nitrospirota bacterium]
MNMQHNNVSAKILWCGLCVLGVAALFPSVEAHAQAMADYTSIPPFIADAVPPNVLLLMDNSGSMDSSAYHDNAEPYNPSKDYNGYFAPTKCYSYGSNKFTPSADKAASGNPCSAGAPWLGSFLNYLTMTRIEITKWVMMGGKCAPRALNGTCYPGGTLVFESSPSNSIDNVSSTGISPYAGSKCYNRSGNNLLVQASGCGGSSTSYTLKAEIAAEPNGIIQAVGSKARFGLMEFKGAGDGGKVLADIGGNITSLVNAIESTTASTYTPLAESLYEATRYFAQLAPAYTNSDYSYNVTSRDPYYFKSPDWSSTPPGGYVTCCKSFVMIFTDGEPTQDTNVPASLQDYAHAYHAAHCTSTPTTTCVGHKTDYASSGKHYLDDVAYYAHTTDLRQATLPVLNETGKDLAGFQNVTVYTFYAFGEAIGREILQTTAKTGGFEDRNGNNQPDLVEEYDKVNNYTGAQGADGLPDTYFESADADDLRDKLLAAITSILQRSASGTAVSVLATSSTGDGSLYQSFFYPLTYEGSRDIKWTGYTQGLFLDTFGNLREDTNADGRLVYSEDKIVRTRFDSATNTVFVDRYHDADGDGRADSATAYESIGLREMKGVWEAGKRLALTDPANRTLLTWVDLNNNGLVDSGEQLSFTTANSATLSPYLRPSASPYSAINPYSSDNIINFIRGVQVTGMRDRQLTVGGSLAVWKYGDPIHSTPTVIGTPKERFDLLYGDSSYTAFFQKYKNRRLVAYLGSNDGMLHAFNGGFYHRGDDPSTGSVVEHGWFTKNPTDNASGQTLGDELWGFIPYQLLPHLKWLTQADYTHVYYVDLKPKVTDVKIFCDSATGVATSCINGQSSSHPNGWGTILIGGFRMGGSCGACVAAAGAPPMTVNISGTNRNFYTAYFVLDITDPEVAPKLLWSFSSSDLGLSTSYPSIVRTSPKDDLKSDNTNAKWSVVFGSGVTGYGGEAGQIAKLFAVDLVAGPGAGNSLVTTMSAGSWKSFMADLITLDKNLDYRSDTVYAGQTIDPTDSGRGSWSGKMYRLTMGTCAVAPCSTSTWGIASGSNRVPTEVLNTFPPSGTVLKMGPMVSAPTSTLDDAGQVWIFFGTGRYYSSADKTNTDTQYFFGVKDSVASATCIQSTTTNCYDNDLVNVSSAQVCVMSVGTCGGSTSQVNGVTGVTTFTGTGTTSLIGLVQSKKGWFTTLPAARERVLVNPTLLGGIAFFPSFIPNDDICSSSGTSNLYALFYLTGSAYTESIVGTTASGSNQMVNRSMSLGTGLAAQMAIQLGGQGTGSGGGGSGSGCQSGAMGFINTSSSTIVQPCTNLASATRSRYVAWMNQRE